MEAAGEYVPGVCNIGGAEAANRRRIGIGGLIAALGLAIVLIALDAPWALGLLVALPAFVAATGLIQARQRFCAGYGMSGMSNFREVLGAHHTTGDPAALAADRARAKRITMQSAVIARSPQSSPAWWPSPSDVRPSAPLHPRRRTQLARQLGSLAARRAGRAAPTPRTSRRAAAPTSVS